MFMTVKYDQVAVLIKELLILNRTERSLRSAGSAVKQLEALTFRRTKVRQELVRVLSLRDKEEHKHAFSNRLFGSRAMKAFSLTFLLCIGLNVPNSAQTSPPGSSQSHQAEASGLVSILGIVSERRERLRFVTEQRVWNVDNPEILGGHEGHYVRVDAKMYPDNGTIHIKSVTMPTKLEIRSNNLR